MGKIVKLLDFDRGRNSIQNSLLKFYYLARLGCVRSRVRISPSRPIHLTSYGCRLRQPFLRCGKVVADTITQDAHSFHRSLFSSIGSVCITARGLRIGMAHKRSNGHLTTASLREPRAILTQLK